VVPRFAGATAHRSTARPPDEPVSTSEFLGAVDRIDLVGRPIDATIADWLASIGEVWSQVTFFLFDPESWR
jgi:hypothetical protein